VTALESLFSGREARNLQDPSIPLTSDGLLDWIHSGGGYGPHGNDTGIPVNEHTSMRMAAVWRCVAVTSGVASALPLAAFEAGTKNRVPSPLLTDPHPEMTALEVWKLSYVHRLLWGNGCLQKIRNGAGQVKELWPITPNRVKIGRVRSTDANPGGKIFAVTDDWGQTEPYTTRDILHLPGLGYDGVCGLSPIRHAATTIGLALAAEKSGARFFARGAQLSGVLQVEQRLTDDQATALQQRWEAKMAGIEQAGKIAVLDSNAKFQPITMPLRDAQYLETRGFQIPEIARIYGVPLFLLFETMKTTSWGTGLEQQAQGWVSFDLHPTWLAPTEQRISKELLPVGREARYNVNRLLRGDSAARAAFYRVMREVGAYNANEIRDQEDLPPIDGGEIYLQPTNLAPLGTEPNLPAPQVPPDPNADPNADPNGDPHAGN
jgi:HK97 family phage portal protein